MSSDPLVLTLTVNGETHRVAAPPYRTLLDILRDDLRLTGAKKGCNSGVCGACNVLVDDEPMRACLCLGANVTERSITTVEGLACNGKPTLVQQAFLDAGAIQCGFCMTGMILSATALLARNPAPTREEIRTGIAGNLCRCSGYVKVVDAIELAARRLAEMAASASPVVVDRWEQLHGH
jgi:carbon-monoxide dehydrogenase small subunit